MKHVNDYYRKLFFDYHMSKSITEIAQGFDAVKWAEQLKEANVDVVSVFVVCGGGYRYYRKGKLGIIHPNLPEGVDMIEDTIRECHKRGIKVIGYSHTWGSEYHFDNHPECCKTNIEGKAYTKELCANNPVFEDVILPQITEITSNYDLDGFFFDCIFSEEGRICHCKHCQDKFRADTGYAHIPCSDKDESYEAYIQWINKCYSEYRKKVADAVHKGNPDMPMSANWGYTAQCPEDVPEEIGFLVQDCWPTNILASEQLQGKNWAFSGKPFSLMNNLSLQWWMSYDIKPYESIVQECMEAIINGGRIWTGFQMYQDYSTHPGVMEMVKNVFGYIKEIENKFDDRQIMPYIGVLHGSDQLYNKRINKLHSPKVDLTSLYGLNRALTQSSIPYNSMNEKELIQNLHSFKAVIIANNQYISNTLYQKLKDYVQNGGNLLITGKSGCVDITGKLTKSMDFEELTGVEIEQESSFTYAYINPCNDVIAKNTAKMPILSAERFIYAKAKNAEILANVINSYNKRENTQINWGEFPSFSSPFCPTDYTAVSVNHYGKGKVCYCATDIFRGYPGTNNWSMRNMIKNIINDVLLCDDAITTDAPTYIEMTLMNSTTNKNILVNLLNTMRSTPVRELDERYENAICEDIVPVYNITISIPLSQKPSAVYTVKSKERLDFTYENKKLSLTVPKVEIYEGIEIIFD